MRALATISSSRRRARSFSSSALRASRASVPRAAASFSRVPATVTLQAVTACRWASSRSRASASAASASDQIGLRDVSARPRASPRTRAGLVTLARRLVDRAGRARAPRSVASTSSRRDDVLDLPLGLLQVLLGRHEREIPCVRLVPRLVQRRPCLRDLRARALQRLEPVGDRQSEQLDGLAELAGLALAVEHSRGQRVALPSRDAPVQVDDGAVEGHEVRRHARLAQAKRRRRVAHHDGVAHEGAHEGLVARGEAKRVHEAQSPLDAVEGDRRRAHAGDEGRLERDDGRAPLPLRGQRGEHLGASLDVAHDDVLEPRPEQPREGQRVLCRGLDAVGDETGDAAVACPDERLGPGAHALEARAHLVERGPPRALASEIALGLLERPLLLADRFLQLDQALLGPRLLRGAQ